MLYNSGAKSQFNSRATRVMTVQNTKRVNTTKQVVKAKRGACRPLVAGPILKLRASLPGQMQVAAVVESPSLSTEATEGVACGAVELHITGHSGHQPLILSDTREAPVFHTELTDPLCAFYACFNGLPTLTQQLRFCGVAAGCTEFPSPKHKNFIDFSHATTPQTDPLARGYNGGDLALWLKHLHREKLITSWTWKRLRWQGGRGIHPVFAHAHSNTTVVFGFLTTTDKERFQKPMSKAMKEAMKSPKLEASVTRSAAAIDAFEKKVGTWGNKLREGEDFTSHAVSFAWRNLDGSASKVGNSHARASSCTCLTPVRRKHVY